MREMNMKTLVIFDLDGTLLNTSYDLMNAVNYALEKLNYNPVTIDEVIKKTGRGIKRLIEDTISSSDDNIKEEALSYFKDYYFNNCTKETYIYDGIKDVLKTLKKKEIKLAVVSNKSQELTSKIISFYFDGIFDLVLGAREGLNLKPERDMIDYVLKEFDAKTQEVIYIGDSLIDYQTAKNSNLEFLNVSYGFVKREVLESNGINTILNEAKEILNYF